MGFIAGTIQQEDGSPAIHVRVAVMPVEENPAKAAGNPGVLLALDETDESGRYRLEAIPPGRYYVIAGSVIAPTFYPGATQISEATTVTVGKNSVTTDINFTISKTSTQPESSSGNSTFSASLNAAIANLKNQFASSSSPSGTKVLTPPPQIQLNGRIVLAEGSKGDGFPGWLSLNQQSAVVVRDERGVIQVLGYDPNRKSVRVSVASDGTFTFDAPEGRGRISVAELPKGFLLHSITAGGRDLLKNNLDVAPQGTPEIVIVVSGDFRPKYRVDGRIKSPSGTDPFGEMIELISESGTTVRMIVGVQGSFAFMNVVPGEYTVTINSEKIGNLRQSISVEDRDVSVELLP